MKHLKGNKNTFQKRMYCKKTEIDLSKSGTGLFEGCKSLTDIHISFYVGSIATTAFRGCRENIRFHADSSGINPKTLKQHIEKELGHSIELYDISGNLVVSTD